MRFRAVLGVLVALTMLAIDGCGESSQKESVHFSKLGLDIPAAYFDANLAPTSPSGDEDYGILHAIFPSMRPAKSSDWDDPNHVRVAIRRINNATTTEGLLSDYERLKVSAAPTRPMLVASSAAERKFIVHVSPGSGDVATYVVRMLPDGSYLSIEDPGTWSHTFSCNRRVGEVQVTYQFRKKGSPDAATLDVAVVSLVERLMSPRGTGR